MGAVLRPGKRLHRHRAAPRRRASGPLPRDRPVGVRGGLQRVCDRASRGVHAPGRRHPLLLRPGASSRHVRGRGRGRASTLTDLGGGRLLRRGGHPAREAALMEHARARGYPVPRIYEVRDNALVLERIDGPTMQDDVFRHPWRLAAHMRTLAGLHHRLHEIEHPDGGTLLHLDLHTVNVLLGPSGPVVIDWTNAAAGDDPALDPALVSVIFRTSGALPGRLASRLFLRHFNPHEIARALPAACAYRLADPNLYPQERPRV